MEFMFNTTAPQIGNSIEWFSQDTIEGSLNLRQASLEDAMRYGGPITRQAISAMDFVGDKKYIVVDTKIHMLLPGMCPSIPGWHTDGVPRGDSLDPAGTGEPRLEAQLNAESPHYHLLVTDDHCPTRFINEPMQLSLKPTGSQLYEDMTNQVNAMISDLKDVGSPVEVFDTPPNTVVEWDWWNIHTALTATRRGWRYLIRVTETDHIKPRTSPNDFIRTHSQVYVPTAYGW